MIYFLWWIGTGLFLWISVALFNLYLMREDIKVEDLPYILWFMLCGPILIIPTALVLYDDSKHLTIFKAKK